MSPERRSEHAPSGLEAGADDSRYWNGFANMRKTRRSRVVFTSGHGCELVDRDGHRYIDATAALWYCNVGHGRAAIARALGDQAERLAACSCFDIYASDRTLELADRVAELVPMDNPAVFLTSGGSDSIETAAKVARRFWAECGQPESRHILSRVGSYHGMHAYGTSLGGIEANHDGLGPLVPDVQAVPAMDADALAAAIDQLGAGRVAGFILEPVIGAGGVRPPEGDYLDRVSAICAARDVLVIVDEVVSGFGRVGTMFASERYGLRPDIMILAKGLTSGYAPLGAAVFSERVAAPFWDDGGEAWLRHGYTYSGHAVACAAALANLDILEAEELVDRVAGMQDEFAATVGALAGEEGVAQVRCAGLLAGVQLDPEHWQERPVAPALIVDACREQGVLTRMLAGDTLQISPAFTIERGQVEQIVSTIADAIRTVSTTTAGAHA